MTKISAITLGRFADEVLSKIATELYASSYGKVKYISFFDGQEIAFPNPELTKARIAKIKTVLSRNDYKASTDIVKKIVAALDVRQKDLVGFYIDEDDTGKDATIILKRPNPDALLDDRLEEITGMILGAEDDHKPFYKPAYSFDNLLALHDLISVMDNLIIYKNTGGAPDDHTKWQQFSNANQTYLISGGDPHMVTLYESALLLSAILTGEPDSRILGFWDKDAQKDILDNIREAMLMHAPHGTAPRRQSHHAHTNNDIDMTPHNIVAGLTGALQYYWRYDFNENPLIERTMHLYFNGWQMSDIGRGKDVHVFESDAHTQMIFMVLRKACHAAEILMPETWRRAAPTRSFTMEALPNPKRLLM